MYHDSRRCPMYEERNSSVTKSQDEISGLRRLPHSRRKCWYLYYNFGSFMIHNGPCNELQLDVPRLGLPYERVCECWNVRASVRWEWDV
jgi:hypothetical protein